MNNVETNSRILAWLGVPCPNCGCVADLCKCEFTTSSDAALSLFPELAERGYNFSLNINCEDGMRVNTFQIRHREDMQDMTITVFGETIAVAIIKGVLEVIETHP